MASRAPSSKPGEKQQSGLTLWISSQLVFAAALLLLEVWAFPFYSRSCLHAGLWTLLSQVPPKRWEEA